MEKEDRKIYGTRISQANKSELVVIIFELAIDGIQQAKSCFERDDLEGACTELAKARQFVQELRRSLNFNYNISNNLHQLYKYVNEQLVASEVRRRDVNLESCLRVMGGLKESFEEVAKQDTSGPVMSNTQTVYAGLTYGRGSLSEMTVDSGNRGFKA